MMVGTGSAAAAAVTLDGFGAPPRIVESLSVALGLVGAVMTSSRLRRRDDLRRWRQAHDDDERE